MEPNLAQLPGFKDWPACVSHTSFQAEKHGSKEQLKVPFEGVRESVVENPGTSIRRCRQEL